MGFLIDLEIETNQGPTNSLYIRIDNYKVNKTVGDITFTTTSWLEKSYADQFLRYRYDQPLRNAIGQVSSKLVFQDKKTDEWNEIELSNLYKIPMVVETEVEEPIFESKEITRELPFTSFDKYGEEITLYKTVKEVEKVKVGVDKVTRPIMDYSIIDRLNTFCYDHLKKELEKLFDKESIKLQ